MHEMSRYRKESCGKQGSKISPLHIIRTPCNTDPVIQTPKACFAIRVLFGYRIYQRVVEYSTSMGTSQMPAISDGRKKHFHRETCPNATVDDIQDRGISYIAAAGKNSAYINTHFKTICMYILCPQNLMYDQLNCTQYTRRLSASRACPCTQHQPTRQAKWTFDIPSPRDGRPREKERR